VFRRRGEQAFTLLTPVSKYFQDVLLMTDLLPDIKQYLGHFTFQQDGARCSWLIRLLKMNMNALEHSLKLTSQTVTVQDHERFHRMSVIF